MIALGFIRSLEKVTPITFLALFCLIIGSGVLFIEVLGHDVRTFIGDDFSTMWENKKLFSGIGTIALGFGFHGSILTCQNEMRNPSQVYLIAFIVIFCFCVPLYLLLGVAGYYVYYNEENKKDNIFDYDCLSAAGSDTTTSDWSMVIGRWVMSMMVVLKTPLLFNSLRDALMVELQSLSCFQHLTIRNWMHRVFLSLMTAIAAFLCSWYVPLGLAATMNGTFFLTPTAIIIPALYMMKQVNLTGTTDFEMDVESCQVNDDKALPLKKSGHGSICWNSRFTPVSRLLYLLCLLLIVFGMTIFLVGGADLVMNRMDELLKPAVNDTCQPREKRIQNIES